MIESTLDETRKDCPFDPALRGARCVLELAGGELIDLPVSRWHAEPDSFDELLLARCHGHTLDIGCGPGRLTSALGVDISPVAVELARLRGALALCADVFDRIPAEGRWRHVLLADGNVGIGGDPVVLLRRVAALLEPTGTALVELDQPGTGLRRDSARLLRAGQSTAWFPWARVGTDAVAEPAAAAGLVVRATVGAAGRWFAELVRR